MKTILPAVFSAFAFSGCLLLDFGEGGYGYDSGGDVQVTSGTAELTWRFPRLEGASTPTCEQAGVSQVFVSIDGEAVRSVPCVDGEASSWGWTSPSLRLGDHTLELHAADANGYVYYRYSGRLPIRSARASATYDLGWAVGGTAVSWSFTNGSTLMGCYGAGVQTVYVNFLDERGQALYPDAGDARSCSETAVVYNFLPPGTYRVVVQARGAHNALFTSASSKDLVVRVTAGQFAGPESAVPVLLYRSY